MLSERSRPALAAVVEGSRSGPVGFLGRDDLHRCVEADEHAYDEWAVSGGLQI